MERLNVAEVAVGEKEYVSVAVFDLLARVADHVVVTPGVIVSVRDGDQLLV